MARFFFTENYLEQLEKIKAFIFKSTDDIEKVTLFLNAHDETLVFISNNTKTPGVHPITGDQSWVFGDGRYRLFFVIIDEKNSSQIYLTHIIDNRQANLKIYPNNLISTYYEED